jgi:hypothetical protein
MGHVMRVLALGLVAAIELGGGFGTASAATVSLGTDTMVIDLEVEVLTSADTVVAHLSADEEALVIPLLARGQGIYGIRTEVPLINHLVVFEVVGPDNTLSDPVTLTELGAELTTAPDDTTADADLDQATTSWGWLGLALAAASLSLLAFWALGDRDRDSDTEAEGTADQPAPSWAVEEPSPVGAVGTAGTTEEE